MANKGTKPAVNKEIRKLPKKGTAKKPVKAAEPAVKKTKNTPQKGKKINIKYLGGLLLKRMARGGANSLGSNADEVNKLNVFPVPDGDTGDNMRLTIESGISAIESIDSDNLADVMKALSHGMLLGARGNSGVILSQFFAGTAKGLESSEKANPTTLGKALELGVKQAYSSVMTPTEGTILTVAREAVEYAVSRITPESTIRTLFSDLVKEMHASLDRTPELLTVLKDAKVVDSGGAGLFYIMDGFNRVLNGEEVPESATSKAAGNQIPDIGVFGPDSEMSYGYCTELLLQLMKSKTDIDSFDIEEFKKFLVASGDSVVAFRTDSIVKLHVHTFEPEKILAYARQYGEFLTVKIENMSVQHTSLEEKEEQGKKESEEQMADTDKKEMRKYGVVAVSNGKGVSNLFKEFGADEVIFGGQTHNPSTNEFLEAFEKVSAEHIFVFPNNGNILMAAKQAADLFERPVHVIPSKSIGTGYVALSSIDFECESAEKLEADIEKAISRVTVGYLSPSIRDADMNGIHINSGDTIGIIDKEIVVANADKLAALTSLASMLLSLPDKSMLTVFTGIDASEEEKSVLSSYLEKTHPSSEVYFIDGGQEIYPFIFVAE